MFSRFIITAFIAVLFSLDATAHTRQAKKVFKIGHLFLHSSLYGGVGRQFFDRLTGLKGVDVYNYVFCTTPKKNLNHHVMKSLKNPQTTTYFLDGEDNQTKLKIESVIKKEKIDYLLTDLPEGLEFCKSIRNKTDVKVIYTIHSKESWYLKYANSADGVICVSGDVYDTAHSLGLTQTGKVFWNNPGFDESKFLTTRCQRDKKNFFNEHFNIPIYNDDYVIVNVGRLSRSKNQSLLLRTLHDVKKLTPKNIKLVIAGSGGTQKNLERILCKLQLEDSVFLIGNTDKIKELFMHSDLQILPSITEAFPLVLLEASCTGLTSIVSESACPKALIEDGKTGIIFDLDKKNHLTEKILWALNNPDLVSRYGHNAQERVIKHFCLKESTKRLLDILEKIKK